MDAKNSMAHLGVCVGVSCMKLLPLPLQSHRAYRPTRKLPTATGAEACHEYMEFGSSLHGVARRKKKHKNIGRRIHECAHVRSCKQRWLCVYWFVVVTVPLRIKCLQLHKDFSAHLTSSPAACACVLSALCVYVGAPIHVRPPHFSCVFTNFFWGEFIATLPPLPFCLP